MNRWLVGLLGVLLTGAAAAEEADEVAMWIASELTPEQAAYNDATNAHIRKVLDALISRATPESLKLAGLLVAGREAPASCEPGMRPACAFCGIDAESVLLRAVEVNRDDALIHWAAVNDLRLDEATRLSLAVRLQQIAPENAAAWLASLPFASGDAIDEVLAAAASAQEHHQYYNDRLRAYISAFDTVEVPLELRDVPDGWALGDGEASARMMLALGLALSDALQGYSPLLEYCADGEFARHDACVRLGRTMATGSDTLVGIYIGLALLRRLDPEDRHGWRARERELQWWSEQAGMASLDPERYGELYQEEALKPGATEIDVLREITRRRGVPLQPPVQWESQRERRRRLYGN